MATIVSTKTSGVGGLSVTGDASGILQLASADGTTALTINASQNVGIGTSSPTPTNASNVVPKLVVTGSGATGIQAIRTITPGGGGAQIIASTTRGTDANSYTALQLNDGIGTLSFNGTDGTRFIPAATVMAQVDGVVSTDNVLGRLVFSTSAGGANSVIERMRIDSSGNVGIGTSSPSAKLEVKSAGNAAAKISTDSNSYAYLTLNTWALDRAQLRAEGANPGAGSGTGSGVLSFWTANNSALAERMRIDSSGNVGIGTSSPSSYGKFAVVGSNTGGSIVNYFSNSWTTATANTQVVLSLDPGGNGYNIRDSQIKATNNGGNQTTLEFYTANAATPSERARINASGQFLIGTSSNYFGENLTVYNNNASTAPVAFFYNPNPSTTGSVLIIQTEGASGTTWKLIDGRSAGGGGRFFVYGNGNVQNSNNSYGAISDESVKESIVDATHKLDDLCKVKIRNFNLKNDENKIKQIGVVAQELEQIFPAMVEEVDGLKGVKYSIFVPILVKAIQELKAIIDTQNARITTLEGG